MNKKSELIKSAIEYFKDELDSQMKCGCSDCLRRASYIKLAIETISK